MISRAHLWLAPLLLLAFDVQGQPQQLRNIFNEIETTTTRPSARFGHNMASFAGESVMFGGFNSTLYANVHLNATYLYLPVTSLWEEVTTTAAYTPHARGYFSFTAASAPFAPLGCAVLFGGLYLGSDNAAVAFNDSYLFSYATLDWVPFDTGTQRPLGRYAHTMVVAETPEFYLYGGVTVDNQMLGDLWRLTLTSESTATWTLLYNVDSATTDNMLYRMSPGGFARRLFLTSRQSSGIPGLQALPSTKPTPQQTVTSNNSTTTSPYPRHGHVSVLLDNCVYVAGGMSAPGQCTVAGIHLADVCYDLWRYNLTAAAMAGAASNQWELVQTIPIYLPISVYMMTAIATQTDAFLILGFTQSALYNVILNVNITSSTLQTFSHYPTNREHRRLDAISASSFSQVHNQNVHIISFGGLSVDDIQTPLNDTWALAVDGNIAVYTNVSPPPTSPPFFETAGATLTPLGVIEDMGFYVFGGQSTQSVVSGEMWRLSLQSFVWERLVRQQPDRMYTIGPSSRIAPTVSVFGPRNESFVLFGGAPSVPYVMYSETWVFNSSDATWLEILPAQRPPGRYHHVAVRTAVDQFCIFGGERVNHTTGETVYLDDTWSFEGTALRPPTGNWAPVALTGVHPPARAYTTFVFSELFREAFLYGGKGPSSPEGMKDVWRLRTVVGPDGESQMEWEELDIITTPSMPTARYNQAAVMLGTKMFIYGGQRTDTTTGITYVYSDLWSFEVVVRRWELLSPSTSSSSTPPPSITGAIAGTPNGETFIVFGGLRVSDTNADSPGPFGVIHPGCSPGYFSVKFFSTLCEICPLGSYSANAGQSECSDCPGDSSTVSPGASSISQCTVCAPNACHHGECTLADDFTATCDCNAFYLRSDNCAIPSVGIAIGSVFFAIILIVAFVWYLRRSQRLKVSYEEAYHLLGISRHALAERDEELKRLRRLMINESQLQNLEKINAGAYGEVYRARWTTHTVAVKFLKVAVLESDAVSEIEFASECQILRSLKHPNILGLWGAGLRPHLNTPFLVTEYCERGSLRDLLDVPVQSEPLGWRLRVRFLSDILMGMVFLHNQNPPILHRDLKGSNILVTENYTCKIGDLGTAKLLRSLRRRAQSSQMSDMGDVELTAAETEVPVFCGTLQWMPPEGLDGVFDGSMAGDVYALAIVIYEIVTRRLPYFHLEHNSWQLEEHICDGGRPIKPDLDSLSPAPVQQIVRVLMHICEHCWQHEMTDRPTMENVREQIETLSLVVRDWPHDYLSEVLYFEFLTSDA